MDTPTLPRGGRHRSRLAQRRPLDPSVPGATPVTPMGRLTSSDDDEEDDIYTLGTQRSSRKEGEVFWDYDRDSKATLQGILKAGDANSPTLQHKTSRRGNRAKDNSNSSVTGKLKLVQRNPSGGSKAEEEAAVITAEALAELKALIPIAEEPSPQQQENKSSFKEPSSTVIKAKPPQPSSTSSSSVSSRSDDTFGPDDSDDALLLMASQQCQPSPVVNKRPIVPPRRAAAPHTVAVNKASASSEDSDLFEDEDDSFMGTLDMDGIITQAAKNNSSSSSSGFGSQPQSNKTTAKAKTGLFRFNSAEVRSPSTSATGVRGASGSTGRCNSSPSVSSPSSEVPKRRCTKAEIERKRQEALERLMRKRNLSGGGRK